VFRRPMLLLPAVIAAMALSVAPALAGEDDDSATLRASSQDCVNGHRAKAAVTSDDDIDSVAFYLDGKLVETVSRATPGGRYLFSMRCSTLSVGAHRGRADVSFESGGNQTLRFLITRSRRAAARFTG
jgi:hypothetical protein